MGRLLQILPPLAALVLPLQIIWHRYSDGFDHDHDHDHDTALNSNLGPAEASSWMSSLLRLGLVCLLILCGPAIKRGVDAAASWIVASRAWRSTTTAFREFLLLDYGPEELSELLDAHHAAEERERRRRGGGRKDKSIATPAVKALVVLTALVLVIHPDGFTWFVLGRIWQSVCGSAGAVVAGIGMVQRGEVSAFLAVAGFVVPVVVVRLVRRILARAANAKDQGKAPSSPQLSSKHHRGKKGKKGRGRQGGGGGRSSGSNSRYQQSRIQHQSHSHSRGTAQSQSQPESTPRSTSRSKSRSKSTTFQPRPELSPSRSNSFNKEDGISTPQEDFSERAKAEIVGESLDPEGGAEMLLEPRAEDAEDQEEEEAIESILKPANSDKHSDASLDTSGGQGQGGRKKKRGKKGATETRSATVGGKHQTSTDASARSPKQRPQPVAQQQLSLETRRGAPPSKGGMNKGKFSGLHLSPTRRGSEAVSATLKYKPTPNKNEVYMLNPTKPTPLYTPSGSVSLSPKCSEGNSGTRGSSVATVVTSPGGTVTRVIRYTVPNYSVSYGYSRTGKSEYPPGKNELAALFAQVGLIGAACADLLKAVADVDSLDRLSNKELGSFGIGKDTRVLIRYMLEARRARREEERGKTPRKKKVGGKKPSFGNGGADAQAPLTPPSPSLPSSFRPPPGLFPVLDDKVVTNPLVRRGAMGNEILPEQNRQPQKQDKEQKQKEQEQGSLLAISSLRSTSTTGMNQSEGFLLGHTGAVGTGINGSVRVGMSESLGVPALSPLRGSPGPDKVGEEDDRLEADMQAMVGSILDF
jgi:hypothetical protein